MKIKLIAALIVCLWIPAVAKSGQTVTASGMSFFEAGREEIAKQKALEEAKRNAIEQAVGTHIQSRTVVENFHVARDQIFSRTSGYLNKYEVIAEKKSAPGLFEITIEADVELAALVSDLDRFQKIIGWQQNPRIAVVTETIAQPEKRAALKKAANLLTDKLMENGFKVFHLEQSGEIEMGLLIGLNLEMATAKTSYQGIDITINEVSLNANIFRPGDGEILASAASVRSLPGENRLSTLDKGARDCVADLWKNLRKKLITLWEKELYSERDVYLIVKNIHTTAEANEIGGMISAYVSGVLGVQLLNFKEKAAEYTLRYRGWPDQFVNEIQMSYFKKNHFDAAIEQMAGNKVVVVRN